LAEVYRLDSKHEVDGLFGLIIKSDWKAIDFLYNSCSKYCRIVYSKKNWHINEEDLNAIINYSIGKAVSKYKVCGKYWGLLSNDFPSFVSFLPSDKARSQSCLISVAL